MRPLDNIVLLSRNKRGVNILVHRGGSEAESYQEFLKRIRIGNPDAADAATPAPSPPSNDGIPRHEW